MYTYALYYVDAFLVRVRLIYFLYVRVTLFFWPCERTYVNFRLVDLPTGSTRRKDERLRKVGSRGYPGNLLQKSIEDDFSSEYVRKASFVWHFDRGEGASRDYRYNYHHPITLPFFRVLPFRSRATVAILFEKSKTKESLFRGYATVLVRKLFHGTTFQVRSLLSVCISHFYLPCFIASWSRSLRVGRPCTAADISLNRLSN